MNVRAAALLFGLFAAAPSLAAGPADLFYERTLMSAAGARCGLFEPPIAAALAASARQARGAALRAGIDPAALNAARDRAQDRAAVIACRSADLAVAADRVRKAFAGYAQLKTMTFPGEIADWRADRGGSRSTMGDWRLLQTAKAESGAVAFGIAGATQAAESLTAVAAWPGALAASGARLVLRDTAKASRPYLDPRRSDLAGRTPPRAMTRSFLASGKTSAAPALLAGGAVTGAAFRFPPAAAEAMEDLDPREAVMLELVYPTRRGERVETVELEVGDFAAARAFLTARR